jgi:hypothetical protein
MCVSLDDAPWKNPPGGDPEPDPKLGPPDEDLARIADKVSDLADLIRRMREELA